MQKINFFNDYNKRKEKKKKIRTKTMRKEIKEMYTVCLNCHRICRDIKIDFWPWAYRNFTSWFSFDLIQKINIPNNQKYFYYMKCQ